MQVSRLPANPDSRSPSVNALLPAPVLQRSGRPGISVLLRACSALKNRIHRINGIFIFPDQSCSQSEPMCMTWENRSISIFSTCTLPIRLIFSDVNSVQGLRAYVFCALFFHQPEAPAQCSHPHRNLFPLGLVPASGKVLSFPLSSFASVSGEAPASSISSLEK